MSKIKVLKFGSDPEFVLKDSATGDFISSIGIIPGTKEEPVNIDSLGEGYTIQIDNVLGEISVAPSETPEGLWDNIQSALGYIKENILPSNIEITHISSADYSNDELDNDVARLFGCSPSINAWTGFNNEFPEAVSTNLRGCGAHIHVSYENPTSELNLLLGQVFDLFCTLPSILLDNDRDRRKFYGKAGEIRHCSYGVELRTLGGFILSDKSLYDYMMKNLLLAIDFINSGKTISENEQLGIQIAINTQNESIAKQIIDLFDIELYQLSK